MSSIIKSIESAVPITALIAIILFIVREILDLIKSRRKSFRSRKALKMLLAYELELNYWSLKSLFNLMKKLAEYESINDVELLINKGIETNYTVKIEEKRTGEWTGQAVPPFYFDRFEKLLLPVGELGENTYEKIQEAYSCLNELNDYRILVLNLFGSNEWLEFPEMTFDYLSGKSTEFEKYYKQLNMAYKSLTGKELTKHRLE